MKHDELLACRIHRHALSGGHLDLKIDAVGVVSIVSRLRHLVERQAQSFRCDNFSERADEMTVQRKLSFGVKNLKLLDRFVDTSNRLRQRNLLCHCQLSPHAFMTGSVIRLKFAVG